MEYLVMFLLILLGVFTQGTANAARNFRGSSQWAYYLLQISGNFGSLLYFVLIIWGFFVFPWWVPVIALLVPLAFLRIIFILSNNILFRMTGPIIVFVLLIWLFFIYIRGSIFGYGIE